MGSSIWARNVGGRLAFLGFPWRSDVVNFGAFCPAEGYSVRNTLHGGRGITWGSERRRGYSTPNPFFSPNFVDPISPFIAPTTCTERFETAATFGIGRTWAFGGEKQEGMAGKRKKKGGPQGVTPANWRQLAFF